MKQVSCSLEKNQFVKCGGLRQYEEEYESKFSNGSTRSAQASSLNIRNKLAGLHWKLTDPF